eukprot:scaffold533627_cov14-Prasinocladus_malaysianus.AAC.1
MMIVASCFCPPAGVGCCCCCDTLPRLPALCHTGTWRGSNYEYLRVAIKYDYEYNCAGESERPRAGSLICSPLRYSYGTRTRRGRKKDASPSVDYRAETADRSRKLQAAALTG